MQVADFFEHAEMRRPTVHGLVVLQLSTGGDVHVLLGSVRPSGVADTTEKTEHKGEEENQREEGKQRKHVRDTKDKCEH